MKKNDDFSKGRRGAVVPVATGKSRITIRIDDDGWSGFASRRMLLVEGITKR
jgi:hypothetical protein